MGLFAPAVRSFLCDARLSHVRIGLFATCRSTSTEAALQDAEALADRKALGYRAFRTHLMDEAQVRNDCTQFVSGIESALARAPNRARSPVHTPGTPGGVDLPTAH